jgi:hypothetical protein
MATIQAIAETAVAIALESSTALPATEQAPAAESAPSPTVNPAETALSQSLSTGETAAIPTTPDIATPLMQSGKNPSVAAEGSDQNSVSSRPTPTPELSAGPTPESPLETVSQSASQSATNTADDFFGQQGNAQETPKIPGNAQTSESVKIAEPGNGQGKKDAPQSDTVRLIRPFFTSPEAFSKVTGASGPLGKSLSTPELAALGTQFASQTDVTSSFATSSVNLESSSASVFGAANGFTNTYHSQPIQSTESVRMANIVERIHQMLENAPIYPPRHITFQLDPPSLGKVIVDLQWAAASGWNVNWSVSHAEVRDWLAQQLPSLQQQQQNGQTPLVWHSPTLQNSSWEQFKQQNPFAEQRSQDTYLADEDFVPEEENPEKQNEFWA